MRWSDWRSRQAKLPQHDELSSARDRDACGRRVSISLAAPSPLSPQLNSPLDFSTYERAGRAESDESRHHRHRAGSAGYPTHGRRAEIGYCSCEQAHSHDNAKRSLPAWNVLDVKHDLPLLKLSEVPFAEELLRENFRSWGPKGYSGETQSRSIRPVGPEVRSTDASAGVKSLAKIWARRLRVAQLDRR